MGARVIISAGLVLFACCAPAGAQQARAFSALMPDLSPCFSEDSAPASITAGLQSRGWTIRPKSALEIPDLLSLGWEVYLTDEAGQKASEDKVHVARVPFLEGVRKAYAAAISPDVEGEWYRMFENSNGASLLVGNVKSRGLLFCKVAFPARNGDWLEDVTRSAMASEFSEAPGIYRLTLEPVEVGRTRQFVRSFLLDGKQISVAQDYMRPVPPVIFSIGRAVPRT